MKIKYQLTKQDFESFYNHHIYKTKSKIFRTVQTTLQILAFSGIFFSLLYLQFKVNLYIAAILGLAIGTVLIRFMKKSQVTTMIKQSNGLEKTQFLELTNEGINIEKESGNIFVRWSGIKDISNDSEAIYFYTTPQCAFILPSRYFKDDREFEDFIKKVNDCRGDSNNKRT